VDPGSDCLHCVSTLAHRSAPVIAAVIFKVVCSTARSGCPGQNLARILRAICGLRQHEFNGRSDLFVCQARVAPPWRHDIDTIDGIHHQGIDAFFDETLGHLV